jgi:methylenetetrahydrofolate dehydrogenase (NADP+) / methenyltetrahydrofolate cyclohydrolase
MTAKLIDGKKISQDMLSSLKKECKLLTTKYSRAPQLAVILVGEDPASHIYVKRKEQASAKVGITSKTYKIAKDCSQEQLSSLITKLNQDANTDAILLQLPLPKHLDEWDAINSISAPKDVDGLSIYNQGCLALSRPALVPCTPQGVCHLIKSVDKDLSGRLVCIIGRSLLVGSPLVKLLSLENFSVVQLHSKSVDAKKICVQADVVVVATGKKGLVDHTWIKEQAVVIDVGIHRSENGLCGDVDFEKVKDKASHLTPVPGGVGPMTIAYLLKNCLTAFKENFKK